ncbi:hypothetical protein NHX12_012196 [Muraenolepis orangiensis]|uniref:C2H2-type domain-containing protein n=1 Tax=Muraenolepis orangiensis TaxID=630683 RepID=A0A9Q0DCK1_9TELE|nr:hypothetical protein NHX12_012196 [Muraenolepis orangiensis]
MYTKRVVDDALPAGGTRGGGGGAPPTRVGDFSRRAPDYPARCEASVSVAEGERGPMPAFGRQGAVGSVLYTFVVDSGSMAEGIRRATGLCPGRDGLHGVEKVCFSGLRDQREAVSTGVLKRASPTHGPPAPNRPPPDGLMLLDFRNAGKRVDQTNGSPGDGQPCPSSHIPVPRHRKPSGHADKEVMAATVLTSLSTSPLVLHPASSAVVPEPAWKEALSGSYSSSTSGNWSWDASDQSVPSTPSPPLSNDPNNKGFLLSCQGEDSPEDGCPESTHFLFEDPIPRKRKNSMKVMFKCLWKNCEKVLSTSSGIQRHVRTLHLGQISDSDYSDGEEDFYYTEIQVNMDSLSEGLSSLTPTSPTAAGPPPIFPPPLATLIPRSEYISVKGVPGDAPTLLSQSAPSTLCHIRTDHAYQGPLSLVRPVSTEVRRQVGVSGGTAPANKNYALTPPAPKPAPGTRKPRGEAKKCRKVYGMEKREMWCTACRWKKACQRFTD